MKAKRLSSNIEDRRGDPKGASRLEKVAPKPGKGDATFRTEYGTHALPYVGDDYYVQNGPDAPDVQRKAQGGSMAKLTTKQRKAIPSKDFALPGRRYPVEDRSHAANALARVPQFGSPAEKAKVRAKVHAMYPDMGKRSRGGMVGQNDGSSAAMAKGGSAFSVASKVTRKADGSCSG